MHADTQRRRLCECTEAREVATSWGMLTATKSWKRQKKKLFPRASRRSLTTDLAWQHLISTWWHWVWTSGLWSCENKFLLSHEIYDNLLQQPQETNTGRKRLNPQGSSKAQKLVPADTGSTYRIGIWRCSIKGVSEHKVDGEECIGLSSLHAYRIRRLCKDPRDGAYLLGDAVRSPLPRGGALAPQPQAQGSAATACCLLLCFMPPSSPPPTRCCLVYFCTVWTSLAIENVSYCPPPGIKPERWWVNVCGWLGDLLYNSHGGFSF